MCTGWQEVTETDRGRGGRKTGKGEEEGRMDEWEDRTRQTDRDSLAPLTQTYSPEGATLLVFSNGYIFNSMFLITSNIYKNNFFVVYVFNTCFYVSK